MTISSFLIGAFATTGGIIVGWALNEVSSYVSIRRERRKPFGRALAYLIQVYQQLFLLEALRRSGEKADSEMEKKIYRDAKLNLHTIAKNPEDFEKRFQDAVEQIAAFEPILASDLSQKLDLHLWYKKLLDGFDQKDDPAQRVSEAIGDYTLSRVLKAFEKLLLDIAKHFSRRHHRELRAYFHEGQRRLSDISAIPTEKH